VEDPASHQKQLKSYGKKALLTISLKKRDNEWDKEDGGYLLTPLENRTHQRFV